jgi:hypothetical protein
MKTTAIPALEDHLKTHDAITVPEFPYGAGWTDIVLTYVSEKYLHRRLNELNIDTPITSKNHLKAFLQLHKRGEISKEYFFSLGAAKPTQKKKSLTWLLEHNFVRETSDGKVKTAPYLRQHITSTFAIELKLSKWKQALKQAHRGKSFAEYQYVVLDLDHVGGALDNIGQFEDYEIGLISLDSDGTCYEHYSPEKQAPFSPLNTWRLNEKTLTVSNNSLEV